MSKDLDALKARFQSGSYIPFPLNNVILQHPHLDKPDTKFDPGGDGKFKVNCIISDDVAEDMTYCGFNVKTNDDGTKFVVCSRKPSLGKPEIVDDLGQVVSGGSIGNGSVADLKVTTKYWNQGGQPAQAIYMEKITITDLVKYEGGTDDDFDPFA